MAERGAWDVAVIGGGPAGLAAASAAAGTGARTVVLERAAHPRYKTCGGGLIGASAGLATPKGWRAFVKMCRSEIALAELTRRPPARIRAGHAQPGLVR